MPEKKTNFLSAEELAISPAERESLLKVMDMLESGEITYDPTAHSQEKGFNLSSVVSRHTKGVCACIVGWSKLLGGETTFESPIRKLAFEPVRKLLPRSPKLDNLLDLFFGPTERDWTLESVTAEQAAGAIRNYLTTGKPSWELIKGNHDKLG